MNDRIRSGTVYSIFLCFICQMVLNSLVVLQRTPKKVSGHGRATISLALLLGQHVPMPSIDILQNKPVGEREKDRKQVSDLQYRTNIIYPCPWESVTLQKCHSHKLVIQSMCCFRLSCLDDTLCIIQYKSCELDVVRTSTY